jgi:alpha-tubulin suppressor-like RCC1 family protein
MIIKRHWRKGIIALLFVGLGLMAGSQMGSGTPPTPTPTPPPPGAVAVGVSAGDDHTCAVVNDNTLKCWGDNNSGQLGTGSTSDFSSTPVTASGLSSVALVAAGGHFTCAKVSSATKCWGLNDQSQIGALCTSSPTNPCLTPTNVFNLGNAGALTAGLFHGCARVGSGVACWGGNQFRQLGNGTDGSVAAAFPVCKSGSSLGGNCVALSGVASGAGTLDAGRLHTCAVLSAGTVECWGSTIDPIVLGDPAVPTLYANTVTVCETSSSFVNPSTCVPLGGIAHVEAGGQHTCAITTGGDVKCWGKSTSGQVGHSSGCVGGLCPVGTVPGVSNATALTAGTAHTCALISDGTVTCWGSNGLGQIGNGQACTPTCPPTVVPNLSNVTAIAALGDYTCAVVQGGGVRCWGANGSGQLGNGTQTDSNVPVTVIGFGT